MQGFTFADGELQFEPFDCVCGDHHETDIRRVLVHSGAIERVVEVLRETGLGRKLVLVSDRNTEAAAGARVRAQLDSAGYSISSCYFDTDKWVRPDERALGSLMLSMEPDTELLVVVGSGALTDVTRLVATRTGLPFFSVATAPSVDGYAGNGAPITDNGYKRTLYCKQPVAVIADTDVLGSAPVDMITSGYSDTLAKLNARVDWQLSRIVTGEHYCPTVMTEVADAAERCIEVAPGIGSREQDAVRTLTEALMISGVAMQLIGHSRPASGSEHSLSHYWEMKAHLEEKKEYFHGTKVGVGTAVIAAFYERFLDRLENRAEIDRNKLKQEHPSREQVEGQVRSVLGPIADRVIAEVTALEYQSWAEREAQIDSIFAHADEILALREISPTYRVIVDAQRVAGAPCLPQEIGVDRDLLKETLLNAMEVRLRFTVLRAADTLGWLGGLAEETVAMVTDGVG